MRNASFLAAVLSLIFAGCFSNAGNSKTDTLNPTENSKTRTPFSAATKIIYHFGDSSVPPQWHRSYTVTVTRSDAQLIIDSYGKVIDESKRDLAETDFEKLIRSIQDANISKGPRTSDSSGCSGSTSESLEIYDQETELFNADVYHCQGDFGTLSGDIGRVKSAVIDLFPDKRGQLK